MLRRPLIVGADQQLISPAAAGTAAYDPLTGDEPWKVYHGGYNTTARPLFSHGMVIINTEGGLRLPAVRPDGEGDVTDTHIVWSYGRAGTDAPRASRARSQLERELLPKPDRDSRAPLAQYPTLDWTEPISGKRTKNAFRLGWYHPPDEHDFLIRLFDVDPNRLVRLGSTSSRNQTVELMTLRPPRVSNRHKGRKETYS